MTTQVKCKGAFSLFLAESLDPKQMNLHEYQYHY